jgi:sulfite reductase alpha subunit-like flavoprotein
VHYTVYGLGDTSYERFCYAGKVLARRLDALGATALVEPAWGDERAPEGYEETFVPWLKRTLEVVVPYLLGPSTAPLEDTELPPPLYVFGYTGRSADAAAESAQTAAEAEAEDTSATLAALSLYDSDNNVAGPSSTSRASSSTAYAPPGWKWATLTTARRLTPKEWWQDVREFELELDSENEGDEAYPPGAVAALHPQCSAGEVSTFLELNGLEAEADREFVLSTGDTDTSLPPHLPTRPTTLRQLLTHHLDLRCAPRKSFFEWLRRLSTDEREIERLDEFIADPDEVHDYATRPSRTVLETQADFRLTRIPLAYVPEVLSPLRRRQFSIASDYSAHKGKIQLLIAMVQYKTNLSVPRVGLCSSWLSGLNEGARIPYALLPPTLFLPAPHVPVILVGPGTGVAPMRAFMEARVGQGAAKGEYKESQGVKVESRTS